MVQDITPRSAELYSQSLVWDTHAGFTPDPDFDLGRINLWRDAGVHYLSIDVGFDVLGWENTVRTLASFRHWILTHDDHFMLAGTAEDVRRARASGKMAVSFDVEGMDSLAGRLEMIESYYQLGVRQMLFAYNKNNLAGGGCHDEDVGLTDFGRAAIEEMNRVGMFVDVSHCSHRTSMEAIAYSKTPVIFSHSNPRAVCDHERNIRDDQIRACAQAGGVIGVVGVNRFMGAQEPHSELLADHVEYLLKVAGPRHVGIGLDYSFPTTAARTDARIRANPQYWPRGKGYDEGATHYASPTQLIELTDILIRRGHSDDVVRGVLGENFLRLAGEVWR